MHMKILMSAFMKNHVGGGDNYNIDNNIDDHNGNTNIGDANDDNNCPNQ